MSGYIIGRGDIRTLNAVLTYDDELTAQVGAPVFWFEGDVTRQEIDACSAVVFTLDDIIIAGLKMAKAVYDRKNEAS